MPSALYAISYKPTSSVIALCRLEKQTLVDQAAWDQLLATLVGNRLPISASTSDPTVELALPASALGCDLVNDLSALDLEPVLAEPFRYRVVADPAGQTVPGDGRPKLLRYLGDQSAISEISVDPGPPLQVKVKLVNAPGVAGARLVFEGRDPISSELPTPNVSPPPKEAVFKLPLGTKLTEGVRYTVMFLMEDAPVEVRRLVVSQDVDFRRPASEPRPSPVVPAPPPFPGTPGLVTRPSPVVPELSRSPGTPGLETRPPPVAPEPSPSLGTPGLVTSSEPRSDT